MKPRPPEKVCGANLCDGSGQTCKRWKGQATNHPGIGRCAVHGGNTPGQQVNVRHELQRIGETAVLMLARLVEGAESETVRLAAVRDVLDRCGFGAVQRHTVLTMDAIDARIAELEAEVGLNGSGGVHDVGDGLVAESGRGGDGAQ